MLGQGIAIELSLAEKTSRTFGIGHGGSMIPVAMGTAQRNYLQLMCCIGIVRDASYRRFFPPIGDRSDGKFGSIAACAQIYKSFVTTKIIDAVRDGDSFGIGWKMPMVNKYKR